MAETIATAYVQILPSAKGIHGEITKELGGESESAGKKSGAGFAKAFGTAAKVGLGAITATGGAIAGLAKIGTQYNTEMETYTTNFATMLGSEASAVEKVNELKKFAASTPLAMSDLADGTKTLLAFGVANEDSTGILRQLGDIALGDADKMKRLATSFGKATAAGKVTGDTVAQMIDAGWNPLIEITKSTGESMEEVQKRMTAGKVSVDELKAAMTAATSEGGQFAGGMEKASHTTAGLMSTLQDNAKALVGEVFQPLSDSILGEILPTAIDSIALLSDAFKTNGVDGMIGAVETILTNVLAKVISAIPSFLELAANIVTAVFNGIMANLPMLLEAALNIVLKLSEGLTASFPSMIPGIVQVITSLVEFIANNADKLLIAAGKLIIALGTGLVKSIPTLISSARSIVTSLLNMFNQYLPKWLEIGSNLVSGLWNGIANKGEWLKAQIKGWVGNVVDFMKNLFGIHSPSAVMRDEVGKNIALGVANGITGNIWAVDNAMEAIKASVAHGVAVNAAVNASGAYSGTLGGAVAENASVYALLAEYLPKIANGGAVNITLSGDTERMFKAMVERGKNYTRMTGREVFG